MKGGIPQWSALGPLLFLIDVRIIFLIRLLKAFYSNMLMTPPLFDVEISLKLLLVL